MKAKEANQTWSAYIRENEDEILKAMYSLAKAMNPFRIDLYLQEDGTIQEFTNIGGNNWIESDEDHIILLSFDGSLADYRNATEYEIEESMDDSLRWLLDDLKYSEQHVDEDH